MCKLVRVYYKHVLRLQELNDKMHNDEILRRINLNWDSKKLNNFSASSDNTWDDGRYTEERFHKWGSSRAGKKEFREMLRTWRVHIVLGKLAARVLCEYMDSRLHCFDNTQDIHPSKKFKQANRDETTKLAALQTELHEPIVARHTPSPSYTRLRTSFIRR